MYFFPFTSYRSALSIRNESQKYSIYRRMVLLLMFFFFTERKVADSFSGFVSEPMAEDRMFRSSSSSDRLRMLCRPTMSEI